MHEDNVKIAIHILILSKMHVLFLSQELEREEKSVCLGPLKQIIVDLKGIIQLQLYDA